MHFECVATLVSETQKIQDSSSDLTSRLVVIFVIRQILLAAVLRTTILIQNPASLWKVLLTWVVNQTFANQRHPQLLCIWKDELEIGLIDQDFY